MGYKHVHEQPIPPAQLNPHLPGYVEQAILKLTVRSLGKPVGKNGLLPKNGKGISLQLQHYKRKCLLRASENPPVRVNQERSSNMFSCAISQIPCHLILRSVC